MFKQLKKWWLERRHRRSLGSVDPKVVYMHEWLAQRSATRD